MTRRALYEGTIRGFRVEVRHDVDDIGRPDIAYIGRGPWGFISIGPLTFVFKRLS